MAAAPENNFSGRLVNRLGEHSCLIDATTDETVSPSDLRQLIISFAVGLISEGLRPRDRILIECNLSPASSIAYLGTVYAGMISIPVEHGILAALDAPLLNRTGARAVWTEEHLRLDRLSETGILALHGLPTERNADE